MKLYEISEEIERFMSDIIDPETGEIQEDQLDNLNALEGELEDKCLNVAAYLKGEIAEGNAIVAHADEIEKVAKGHRERADKHFRIARSLKDYLQRYAPQTKMSDSRAELTWRKSTAVVLEREVATLAELKVPKRYLTRKVTISVDKAGAKKTLVLGKKIQGLRLDERNNLTVK